MTNLLGYNRSRNKKVKEILSMFATQDDYIRETKYASINTHDNNNGANGKLIVLNLFLVSTLTVMGYFGFKYVKNETNFFQKTNVMGVSYVNDSAMGENDQLMSLLNGMEVDKLDNSGYTKAISKEINGENEKVVVVKAGDTLASLAEKFYGNSMAFDKIIANNPELDNGSNIIRVGQELKIPL